MGGVAKFGGLFGQAVVFTAFAEPEVLAIGRERGIEGLMEEQLSRLRSSTAHIEKICSGKPHVRSSEVEEVLGSAQDPSVRQPHHGVLDGHGPEVSACTGLLREEIELVPGKLPRSVEQ